MDIIYLKRRFFGQVNKLQYSNKSKENNLEKSKPVVIHKKEQKVEKEVSEEVIKRENTIISILINNPENYEKIKQNMSLEDFRITDNIKAIEDILKKYEREKLEKRRDELIKQSSIEQDQEKKRKLGEELNNVILKLVKIKIV